MCILRDLTAHSYHYKPTDLGHPGGISGGLPGAITCSQHSLPQMQLTLQPDPTAQLLYRVLVITEKKRGRSRKQFPIQPSSFRDFQVVGSAPLKGCDGRFMLHQPFPAELLPVQSALQKPHHRGGANLGQHLEAPGGNKCSLLPSVPAPARVCTDIIFSLYPLI